VSNVPEFVDELPTSRPGRHWPTLLEEFAALVANPGRWAVLETRKTGADAHNRKTGLRHRASSAPNDEHRWEFAARGTVVYGRYIGEAQ
jgi:hypothetical protein